MNYPIKSIAFFALGLAMSFSPVTAKAATGQTITFYEFTNEVSTIGWSSLDANEDGVTWGYTPSLNGLAYLGNTTAAAGNDWLFSPAISLDGGTDFLLEYTVALRGCFAPETIEFYLGSQPSVSSMTQQLVSETYNFDAGKVTRYCHIHLDTPQPIIYVGLHSSSPAANGIVSLKRLRVSTADPQQPEPVYSMAVVPNKAAGTLKVKWLNPERDINNAHISTPLTASVAVNGTVVATADNCLPGEESSVVITPEATSGKITVSVTTAVDPAKPALATEMLVDLDDEAGPRTLEANFTINTREEFAEWTVLNPDNNANKFTFDYGSAYLQGTGKCNDWLITPAVELTAGTRYLVRYKAKTSGSQYYADFKITVGQDVTAAAQSQTIGQQTKLLQNGFGEFTTAQFSVNADGNYYIGFNATYVGNSLDIKDVQIYSIAPGGEFDDPELSCPYYGDDLSDDLGNGLEFDAINTYNRRLSGEGIELYYASTAALLDPYTQAPNGLFHVPYDNGAYSIDLNTPDLGGMFGGGVCYHDGKIYCNEYDYKSDYQAIHPVWKIYDASTFELLSETALPDNGQATTICLTYCTDNDRIYGFNRDYSDTRLMEIDPATGAMTDITGVLDPYKRFVAITSTTDGQLLCIYLREDYYTGDQTHYRARIDRSNGHIATIGQITGVNLLPEDIIYNMKYRQAMYVNHSDGSIYWTFGSSSMAVGSEYMPTLRINPVSANATLCHYVTDVQAITGAFFIEPRVGAPAAVTGVQYVNDPSGANSGTLSFTMPTTTYNGQPLSGDITYDVTEANGKLTFHDSAAPGTKVTIPIEADNDLFNISITSINAAGTSAAISYEFLVGWDTPDSPTNVTLVDEGLDITLTWKAPTAGIHGQPFNPETLRYIVLDYMTGEVLARGLTECTYSITAAPALRRHCYAIYSAINDTPTAGALSNSAVVGDPIEPPFGGVFQSREDFYNYYTVIDDNNDRSTWGLDTSSGAAMYFYSYYNDADDWLISPPLRLKAGEEYTLQFGAFSSNEDYLETMDVVLLLGKTVSDVLYNLMAIDPVPALDEDNNLTLYSIPVTVDSDGVYYYGFHVTSPAYSEYLVLYDIEFVDAAGVNDIAVDPATATPTEVYDIQGRRLSAPARGVNIVRFSDGSAAKILIP